MIFSQDSDIKYCEAMLPLVSRTFAPTIEMLPRRLMMPVNVAYLFCRIADTIEDSKLLFADEKREILDHYIALFLDPGEQNERIFKKSIEKLPVNTADEKLVHNFKRVLNVYRSFTPRMQACIAKWVVEMCRGMQKYAQSYQTQTNMFLTTMHELDEYTYYVAGTVGRLLTDIFSTYSRKITPPIQEKLLQVAESFGKGLQLVNIIRDMATDLKRGQSYIPDELLSKYDLTRESIFKQENRQQAVMLFNELIEKALFHLDNALTYILNIPLLERRIRLFCMLPLFWALRTLQKIRENVFALLEVDKVKISRSTIRKELLLSFVLIFSNGLTRIYYNRIRSSFTPLIPEQAMREAGQ